MPKLLSWLRAAYESDNDPSRLIPMEGLRGLAVLLVFFVHFHGLFGSYLAQGSTLFNVSRFGGLIGHSGVDLFFVISGYLIYGYLLRRPITYSRFMRRRVERIFPAFLCVFVIYLVLSVVFPSQNKIHGPVLAKLVYIA